MKDGRRARRSDLFLVRVWVEESGSKDKELRGRVQRAVNGEAHCFRNLLELEDLLRSMTPGCRTGKDSQLSGPDISEQ